MSAIRSLARGVAYKRMKREGLIRIKHRTGNRRRDAFKGRNPKPENSFPRSYFTKHWREWV